MKKGTNFKAVFLLAVSCAVLIFTGCKKKDDPAPMDDIKTLKTVTLSGENQVPSITTSATGTFTGTYDATTKILSYTVTYSGTVPTAMHFHNSLPGTNGGVEFTLTTPVSSPASGMTTALSATQEADLLAGKFYLNIHSAAEPNGVLRAQILTDNLEIIRNVKLSGNKEVPSSGSTATGIFNGIYNKTTKKLTYNLEYTGAATPTAMHIHEAKAGTNGSVIFTLTTPTSSPATGTTDVFTDWNEASLLAGDYYINMHTSSYANGEIRGQLATDNILVIQSSMTADNEVPGSGSTGSGTFYVTYNKTTKILAYTIVYSGLGAPTSMHIHNGAAGANGGVEFTLTTPTSSPSSGMTVALTAAQEADLLAGNYYANIHSANFANGEVRGQLVP
ncbi:CHRD domain-containing protein [Cytophaga aurantiaca]|uniref:CHRD domain-containing protein n=1 Tax=Cytophaga aurantiaca TaxID=29530 RepID=UPI0003605FAC|nr:CHRD domain-containing protein [Cytophaga aurantiaca]